MKQILQNIKNGETFIVNSPDPSLDDNSVLIQTTISLISSGTEKSLVDFGKSSYLEKALKQPEKVNMVLNKLKTDGLFSTIDAVKTKLDQPIQLGYCNVGKVIGIGKNVRGLSIGDRVVSNGPHAERVCVGKNLCAKIPDEVSDSSAVYTVLGSIALQGIRLIKPSIGENVAVIGTGLIGLLSIQILRANGCKVWAVDFDDKKLEIAKSFGAETFNPNSGGDQISSANSFTLGRGMDSVLITASSNSNEIISNAAKISRKRGKIVLVGVTGPEIKREDFYEKELQFQVSCSYGPGRYDKSYEEEGNDYPYDFVRWTEQRNFEAILNLLKENLIKTDELTSKRYKFINALDAYQDLTNKNNTLGLLIEYEGSESAKPKQKVQIKENKGFNKKEPIIGFIGAGNYASRILLPAFKKSKAQLHTLGSKGGTSSLLEGKKRDFLYASTNIDEVCKSKEINSVVIATRHDSHSKFVLQALKNKKNVFVEKPLALTHHEISDIEQTYSSVSDKVRLIVGFNRRFSPFIKKMKKLIDSETMPKAFIFQINAGHISKDHWTQDKQLGGGRVIGEACHFIDLMRHLAGSKISSYDIKTMSNSREKIEDNCTINLNFEDGSFGTIHYLSNGSKTYPKENMKVFVNEKIIELDNFIRMHGYGWNGFSSMRSFKQNKGQNECVQKFLESIRKGEPSPIPISEIFEVANTTISISDMIHKNK